MIDRIWVGSDSVSATALGVRFQQIAFLGGLANDQAAVACACHNLVELKAATLSDQGSANPTSRSRRAAHRTAGRSIFGISAGRSRAALKFSSRSKPPRAGVRKEIPPRGFWLSPFPCMANMP